MDIKKLTDRELLDQHEDLIRWRHYDPMGSDRPSKFDSGDLRQEILRRMAEGANTSHTDE